ncbi:unnamed protein product [Cylindrotheca closterium]|uniref:CRAL-TRIO domain-containing protein n=1 Tax=Cylindrotheca closterium TaxID=2856 RepID=A0AAD2PUF4_9STRA|nr:unnamed protein product [Cylindrotheca closterium]
MDSSGEIIEVWDKEQLMAKVAEDAEAAAGKSKKTKDLDQLMLWGQPGHLSEEEADTYMKFKAEVEKRDKDFKDTIYSFGTVEGEVYAYCRWLRARKYNLADTIAMVEGATECRAEAKRADFWPDPSKAIGCEVSHYISQYPQCYTGYGMNGAPVFISKPGVLNTDAVECVTTIENVVKFHWFAQMHDFGNRLRSYKEKNPEFKRFECICILDLEGLTMSQLSQRTLAIVKDQSAIDSLCFPETMNKMYIVNGPRFFSATWKMIKGWIDPRTASKVEVVSSRDKWEEKLRQIIDVEQLPSDYGGKATDSKTEIEKANYIGDLKKVHTEVIYVRGSGASSFEIAAGEQVDITIYTRSKLGANFCVVDGKTKKEILPNVEVKHTGGESLSDLPTCKKFTEERLVGPMSIKVKADSNAGRFTTHNFLAVFSVYRN